MSTEYVIASADWEGYVERVDDEGFVALLLDKRRPHVEERTKFLHSEISSFDEPLVREGAVFYWTIGYRVRESGQREALSLIRFRRLPRWTPRALEALTTEAAEQARALGWDGETDVMQDGGELVRE